MSFTDPTGGIGYAFGEVLPSSDMTTIAAYARAIDGGLGGSYAPSDPITIAGDGIQIDKLLNTSLQGTLTRHGGVAGSHYASPWRLNTTALTDGSVTIRDSDAGAIADVYLRNGNITGNRIWTIGEADNVDGELCLIATNKSGAFTVEIKTESSGSAIATIPSGPATAGESNTNWYWVLCVVVSSAWQPIAGHHLVTF